MLGVAIGAFVKSLDTNITNMMKLYKKFSDLVNIKKDINFDYENNLNSIIHKIEMARLDYIDEKKLKAYDKLGGLKNDDILIDACLKDFCTNYGQNQSTIYMPVPLTKKIIGYDFEKNNFFSNSIECDGNFKFYDYSRYITSRDHLIITGGVENEKELSNCYLYNTKQNKLLQLSSLNRSKSQHSMFFA